MPITQLLKDAVDLYLIVLQREMQAVMVAEQDRQVDEAETSDDDQTELVSPTPADDDVLEFRDENSPTGRMPLSGCHVDRRMIAEFENSSETDHIAGINLSSEPKTQLGFIFSED